MGLNQWTDNHADDGRGADGRPTPRHGRASLLRLAAWFEEADPDRADALSAAAYALHPALHLEGRVDEGVAATTSWWQAEADRSTVTEHPGARPPEPVSDHRAQQARLRDAAESSAHWRRAGAAQIRSLLTEPTGRRTRLDLSGAGMEVLMELLTAALGSGDASRRPTSAGDLEFALRLHVVAAPGADVTIRGEGGELTLEGLRLLVTSYEQHSAGDLAPLPEEPEEGAADPLADGSPEEDASAAGADADPLATGNDEDLTEGSEKPSEDPQAPTDSAVSTSTDVPAAPSAPFDPRTQFTPATSEGPEAPPSSAVPQYPANPDVPPAPESAETSDDPLNSAASQYSAASDRSVSADASAGSADAEAPTVPSVPTDPKNPEAPAPLFDPRLSTASDRSASTGAPEPPVAPSGPAAPFDPRVPVAPESPETPPSPAVSGTSETSAASAEPSFPQSPAIPPYSADPAVPPAPEILGTPAAPSYADILGLPPAPAAPAPRPEDPEPTGNLPGPDPETPGPDDLSANPSETRSWE
ncbi:DUF2397 family protein [Nocardiopsis synnemataformans]|uniref:DUF2397 family protein n=1 Tax=Nocardiopsis synnemataformans TaxID=61305 RepID=UPI003EBE1584